MKKGFVALILLIVMFFSFGCAQTGVEVAKSTTEQATESTAETTESTAENKEFLFETDIFDKYYQYASQEVKTRGVSGEKPIWFTEVFKPGLTKEEIDQVREKNASVAWVSSDMVEGEQARVRGGKVAMEELNMRLLEVLDSEMDPVKQLQNIESVMALKPDCITSIAIDAVQAREAFRPAVENDVVLSFLSVVPEGYQIGKDYTGMITADAYGCGEKCAQMLADAIRKDGKKGKIGYVYFGATFWICNEWDKGFIETIKAMPDMEVVAEQGFTDSPEAEGIVSAMITQHPELNGVYCSFTTNAEYALAAIRTAERPDIKLVCNENTETLALDMAKGGNFVGSAMFPEYLIGYTRIYMLAWGLLDKSLESFCITPVIGVTKENLEESWIEVYNKPLPDGVLQELKK